MKTKYMTRQQLEALTNADALNLGLDFSRATVTLRNGRNATADVTIKVADDGPTVTLNLAKGPVRIVAPGRPFPVLPNVAALNFHE